MEKNHAALMAIVMDIITNARVHAAFDLEKNESWIEYQVINSFSLSKSSKILDLQTILKLIIFIEEMETVIKDYK